MPLASRHVSQSLDEDGVMADMLTPIFTLGPEEPEDRTNRCTTPLATNRTRRRSNAVSISVSSCTVALTVVVPGILIMLIV